MFLSGLILLAIGAVGIIYGIFKESKFKWNDRLDDPTVSLWQKMGIVFGKLFTIGFSVAGWVNVFTSFIPTDSSMYFLGVYVPSALLLVAIGYALFIRPTLKNPPV